MIHLSSTVHKIPHILQKKFKYLRLVVLVIKIQITILEAVFRGVNIECNDFPGEAWSLLNREFRIFRTNIQLVEC